MDDAKLNTEVYQTISHWGLFDTTVRDGVVRIQCDADGMPRGHIFEPLSEVLPLLVVDYEDRGQLIIMGDHGTGIIRDRLWFPEVEGAMPPRDEFTTGMKLDDSMGAPSNATRH